MKAGPPARPRGYTDPAAYRAVAVAFLAWAGGAGAEPVAEHYRIVLPAALQYRCRQAGQTNWASEARGLILDLVNAGTNWEAGAWGFVSALPGQEHPGRVLRSRSRGTRGELTVDLFIRDNALAPTSIGGTAEVTLRWRRDGARVAGEFRIVQKGRDSRETRESLRWEWGTAAGYRLRPADVDRQLTESLTDGESEGAMTGDVRPLAERSLHATARRPGEHPCLLFDARDLDRLRQAWRGETGERIFAQWRDRLAAPPAAAAATKSARAGGSPSVAMHAAAGGLLFHLAGETNRAAWARDVCWQVMVREEAVGWHTAEQLAGVALCYDLFHGAWASGFREAVRAYLDRQSRQIARISRCAGPGAEAPVFPGELSCGWPSTSSDTWFTRYRAAAGLAALAILDDPPLRPSLDPVPAPDLAPAIPPAAAAWEPPIGVPVERFAEGEIPRAWLFNGPFFVGESGPDPLAAIGGRTGARPAPGTVVEQQGVAMEFRRLHTGEPTAYVLRSRGETGRSSLFHHVGGRPSLWTAFNPQWDYSASLGGYEPAARAAGASGRKTLYLYTVIRNDTERAIRFRAAWQAGCPDVTLWLNGREMSDGDAARIAPGLYPMLVEVPLGWNLFDPAPRLSEYTEDDRLRLEAARVRSRGEAAFWPPGLSPAAMDERVAARWVQRFLEESVDASGWSDIRAFYPDAMELALPFLIAHRRVTGENLAAGTGVERLAALAALLGPNEFQHVGLGEVVIPLGYALAGPMGREWVQERLTASGGDGTPVAEPWYGLAILASYPLPAPKAAGRDGSRTLPFEWPGAVWYGYPTLAGPVAVAFRMSHADRSGGFALACGGHSWAVGNTNGLAMEGFEPAAIQTGRPIPDAPVHVVRQTSEYRALVGSSKRSLAVEGRIAHDASGASGAPFLMAVLEQVPAGASRVCWQMDVGGAGAADVADLTFDAAGFSLRRKGGGVWLKATVLAPERPAIWMDVNGGTRKTDGGPHPASRGSVVRVSDRAPTMVAPSPVASGRARTFLTILTLQDGPAPDVQRRDGDGKMRVVVGKRTLVFDEKTGELTW